MWHLRQQTEGLPRGTYSVYGAWLRGLIYLCGSAILAVLTGVIGRLIGQPLATAANLADPVWFSLTALCVAVEIVAYCVIWPKGTLPHGRARHVPSVLVFGAMWGISEALVFLSIWALAELIIPARWGVGLAVFENPGLFILFQIIALLGSAWFMRFPAWTQIKARR